MKRQSKAGAPRAGLILVMLVALATVMTVWTRLGQARQLEIALGPATPEQRSYFESLVERPDLQSYFKSLTKNQKLTIARNLSRHLSAKVVKLTVMLLSDFDEDVRSELTRSLAQMAGTLPDPVSLELASEGSFQRRAVFAALSSLGSPSLSLAARRLEEDATRSGALDFLVWMGRRSGPTLLEALESGNPATRLAAAEGLARISYAPAGPLLFRLYRSAGRDERLPILTAIAALGRADAFPLLAQVLEDERAPAAARAQAALGLGRMAKSQASRVLWAHADDPNSDVREAVLSGLKLGGRVSLMDTSRSPELRVLVAEGVRGKESDQVIREALARGDRRLRLAAASAAGGRPQLVADLLAAIKVAKDGDELDRLASALLSTEQGTRALAALPPNTPAWAMAQRRRILQSMSRG